MTNSDVKLLRSVIKEEVAAVVKDELKPVNEKLDAHGKMLGEHGKMLDEQGRMLREHGKILGEHGRKIDILWDQVERVTISLENIKDTQKLHTAVLKRIEVKVENNSDDIRKVDKRLTKAENRLGIVPPPELTIVR